MKFIDLTGQKFNRLTVIKRVENPHKLKKKEIYWLCKCDCGNETILRGYSIKSGNIKSCGCYHREKQTTHDKHGHQLYSVWCAIIQRCYNENNKHYFLYGGRGIKMCDEWRKDFQAFYDWAYSNGYTDEKNDNGRHKLTIDRIDNNGNYEPSNCRWITQKEQSNNTRRNHFVTINGETKTMQQWADAYNMSKHTLYARYAKGLRGEDLIAPVKKYRERKKK
jgi:hypothetical protein